MRAQFDNIAMSSFLLWVDHKILEKGDAYSNTSSYFYPVQNTFSGYYTYGSPFSQFVGDASIAGATVPTGIYLDGSFLVTGQSGFMGINYAKGQVHFNTVITGQKRLSGAFAIKDFAVALTTEPEEKLLFKTKYTLRPKVPQTATGLSNNENTFPIIWLRKNGSENAPFSFGELDLTTISVTAVIVADSQFSLDAVTCILRDTFNTAVPLVSGSEVPFNVFGHAKSGIYNYNLLTANKLANNEFLNVTQARESVFNQNVITDAKQLNPSAYFGLVDFKVQKARHPRV